MGAKLHEAAKFDRRAIPICRRMADTPLATWMANLRGFREQNAWRYIAMLGRML